MKITIAIVLFLGAAVGVCFLVHKRNETAAREKTALLAQQSEQIASLQAEQKRLSGLAARSKSVSEEGPDHRAELAKLRAQAEALREQTNRLAREKKTAAAASPRSSGPAETHPPQYYEELHKAMGTKPIEARDVAHAAYQYAMDHKNQVPTNMDQIASYLAESGRAKPTTNRFEFVFTGSLDQLKGIPQTSIAIVRDTQTVQGPDGKQLRVYGMMGGVGQIVTSDDNFKAWEAEHVISAPAGK